jgi:hypothetical protein
LDVQPNPPSELPFLPAVDVTAASSEIPFLAEVILTAAPDGNSIVASV